MTARRATLLAAALTILGWGRIATDIKPGRPLGSFEQWGQLVRDPLLALGCHDPVERVSEAKERDGRRQAVADLFSTWWHRHGERPLAVSQLHEDVVRALDPQGRGRQYVAAQAEKLAGTRLVGFVLTRQAPAGKWGAATYALKPTDGGEKHRGHRGHQVGVTATTDVSEDINAPTAPMPPMPPMPSPTVDDSRKDGGRPWSMRV